MPAGFLLGWRVDRVRGRMMEGIRLRRVRVQLPLDLLETPAPLAFVWDGLPNEDQVAVVVALARLIAQAAVLKEPDVDAE
jgi:hypothetical protein